jgi:hypothetical protein
MSDPHQLLGIYLNDHLAGSLGGLELARRARGANQDDDAFGVPLAKICSEIESEREALTSLMEDLDIRRDPLKPAAAWAAEKVGRLKLNGQVTGYSPLSRLVELEGLLIGITGKRQMWNALAQRFGGRRGAIDFEQLAEQADRQRDVVRDLHSKAAALAFPMAPTSA